MSSILKTDALIRSITRRAFIPTSQETFTSEDFLEMATEEVNLGLVPLIQRMHEEHLIYFVDVPLISGQTRYAIPSRAHGNKLRDVALVDENGNTFEMHRYSLSEISDFTSTTSYSNARGFYLENNDVILSNFESNVGQFLRMYFYMRPNVLVKEDRGAIIESITTAFEVDFITPASGTVSSNSIATETVIISAAHGLTSGQTISITGSNSTPSIDGTHIVSVSSNNTFSIPVAVTVAGNAGAWQLLRQCKQLSVDLFPLIFASETYFDFVQDSSPNKIIHFDIQVNSLNQNTNTLSFTASDVPNISAGNYITLAEETIVPNIPTELHPILAQRVAVACLEAMGDEANKQSAERKLASMERDAGTFLDNRVEGAVQKIKSRHSPLVGTLNTLGRRNRRW
jgi:hypothetical protein